MSKHQPIYLSEFAELVGLDENRWDVAISKQKGTGGRKVIVWVRDKKTGKVLVNAVSGRMTKGELGYYLEDAVELAEQRDDLSPPSKRKRENCKVGDSVKLLFRFAAEDAPREDNQTERMWVTITNVDDDYGYYTGVIDNEPIHSTAAYGDELQFHPLNIAEIIKKRGRWSWS